jgi:hypothetical protein
LPKPQRAFFERVVVNFVWGVHAKQLAQRDEMRLRTSALGHRVAATTWRLLANKVFRGHLANVAGCDDLQIGAAKATISTRFDLKPL